MSALLVAGN